MVLCMDRLMGIDDFGRISFLSTTFLLVCGCECECRRGCLVISDVGLDLGKEGGCKDMGCLSPEIFIYIIPNQTSIQFKLRSISSMTFRHKSYTLALLFFFKNFSRSISYIRKLSTSLPLWFFPWPSNKVTTKKCNDKLEGRANP